MLRRDAIAGDELAVAEGHRHLLRMIRLGFEVISEYGDPTHPVLFPMAEETKLSEGVTCDARYHQAFIDGSATHRIRGTRGTAPLLEIGVYAGRMGFHPSTALQGCLTEAELEVAADGTFEVGLGPEPQGANWIRTDASTHYVFIRQYAHHWTETQSGSFEIEREGVEGPRAPLSLDEIREALAETAAFVARAPAVWTEISDYWVGHALNQIVPQEEASSDTDIAVPSGHRFACGAFRLAAGEALVVRFHPPEGAAYWGLHLDNYWFEPLSWGDTRSQLNDRTAQPQSDGTVEVVVSARE